MKNASTILLLLLGALVLAACSNQAVYTGESFSSDSPFRMRAHGDVAMACESARRALLGQGYLIDSAGAEGVKGRKAYKAEDAQNTFIEMNIVCLGEMSGSTLYATGVLTTYALKKSTSSASVGLSALGSISLPIGQSADSLVKVSEETIDDKDFYKRFFSAVDIILGEMGAMKENAVSTVTGPAAAESAPQPSAPAASAPAPEIPAAPQQPAAAIAAPAAAPATPALPAAIAEQSVPAQPVLPHAVPPSLPPEVSAPSAADAVPETIPTRTVTATPAAPMPAAPMTAAAPPSGGAHPTAGGQDILEPFPVRDTEAVPAAVPDVATTPLVPEPVPVQSTPVAVPEPASPVDQAAPAKILEEFAAPRSTPF